MSARHKQTLFCQHKWRSTGIHGEDGLLLECTKCGYYSDEIDEAAEQAFANEGNNNFNEEDDDDAS